MSLQMRHIKWQQFRDGFCQEKLRHKVAVNLINISGLKTSNEKYGKRELNDTKCDLIRDSLFIQNVT